MQRRAFTLVELLATISIIAILATILVVAIPNFVTWAKSTSDKQTLTVLNDALTRYKTQGGGVAGLTAGASASRVIALLKNATGWGDVTHQFLQSGATYPGRSIGSQGDYAQYHFTRYNTYSDGSGQSNASTGGSWPAFVSIGLGAGGSYSYDGVNWIGCTGITVGNQGSITYGNGKFVGASYLHGIMYSTDGISWRQCTGAVASISWWCVCYGNGAFTALGSGTEVGWSNDGINWTVTNSQPRTCWSSIAYGSGKFVAGSGCGGNGFLYSSDGITWTWLSNGISCANLFFLNGSFIGCNNTTAYHSTDGINWTSSAMPAVSSHWSGIGYGNGLYVAASNDGFTATSTDGINWSTSTIARTFTWGATIAYANGIFIATGNNGAYSTDGINWINVNGIQAKVTTHQ